LRKKLQEEIEKRGGFPSLFAKRGGRHQTEGKRRKTEGTWDRCSTEIFKKGGGTWKGQGKSQIKPLVLGKGVRAAFQIE